MNFAILLAAGKGKRMNSQTPKALIEINNLPIFYYSLMTFYENININEIILVVDINDFDRFDHLLKKYQFENVVLVEGGNTRSKSLSNGVKAIKNLFQTKSTDIIITHDVARIFVNDEMINESITVVKKHKLSTVAITTTDTIIDLSKKQQILDRSNLYQVQTPQACELALFKENKTNNLYDLDLVKYLKYNISYANIVKGDMLNFKITYQEDLDVAYTILKEGK